LPVVQWRLMNKASTGFLEMYSIIENVFSIKNVSFWVISVIIPSSRSKWVSLIKFNYFPKSLWWLLQMHVGVFGLRRCGWTVTLTGPESDLIFGMQLFLYMIIADKSCIAWPIMDCHDTTGFELSIKGTGKIRCLKLVEVKFACRVDKWTAQFWKGYSILILFHQVDCQYGSVVP